MCMISLPINEVSNTNIFVAQDNERKRQLTIYSNLVDNSINANAMIIPVPHPETVLFHDMSTNKNFFKECDRSFFLPTLRSSTLGTNSLGVDSFKKKKIIVVQQVGSYNVSLIPSIDEFENIDTNVFILSDELKQILKQYYSEGWGFIAFILNSDKKEYHPFAFSHDLLNGEIYIPTRHFHLTDETTNNTNIPDIYKSFDREFMSYDAQNIDKSPMFNNGFGPMDGLGSMGGLGSMSGLWSMGDPISTKLSNSKQNKKVDYNSSTFADDWSHSIYIYNTDNVENNNQFLNRAKSLKHNYQWTGKIHFDKTKFPEFDWSEDGTFTKIFIEGTHQNIDIMI